MNFILYILNNIHLSIKGFYKNFLKAFFSSIGIVFIITFLVVFMSVRTSVKNYIGKDIFGQLDINEIVISMPGSEKTTRSIKPYIIRKIRNMGEFKNIYTVTKLDYRTKVRMEMMGKSKAPHVPICGISRAFFIGKDKRWRSFVYRKGGAVPIIAPSFVLKLLNNFAKTNNWPLFTEKVLRGFPLEIQAYTRDKDFNENKFRIGSKLHGFSSAFSFTGVLVPQNFIAEFAKQHRLDSGKSKRGYSYIKVFAAVKDIKRLPEITGKLKRLGLAVESRSDISKKTNKAMQVLDAIFILIGGIIVILTVISIFNSYLIIVNNRSYSFSLKRVIGYSKLRIVFEFVIEASIIGFILGTCGYFFGFYCVEYISKNIGSLIPALKGIEIIRPADNLLGLSVFSAAAVSALSALGPALIASNLNLFRSVKK